MYNGLLSTKKPERVTLADDVAIVVRTVEQLEYVVNESMRIVYE